MENKGPAATPIAGQGAEKWGEKYAEGKDKGRASGTNKAGGSTVESKTQVEALKDSPFVLNQRQPVPPYFRAAYQRKALIVFEFFKEGEDPFYPQGLEMDDIVDRDLNRLRSGYPEIEFFAYGIGRPVTRRAATNSSVASMGRLLPSYTSVSRRSWRYSRRTAKSTP